MYKNYVFQNLFYLFIKFLHYEKLEINYIII